MLSIIIVNYRNQKKTIKYVKEELKKIRLPNIIVIVNNEATNDSNNVLLEELKCDLIKDINIFPSSNRIFLISSDENLGFARANNLGVQFSLQNFEIEYILFTNNDIRILNVNTVEILIDKLKKSHDIGLIGPRIIGEEGFNQSPEPYISFWKRYIWMYWLTPFLSKEKKKSLFYLDYMDKAKEGIHYKVMGSFFIMKASDFMTCGMMDPNTFLFAEEVILSERLTKIGKHVYFYPEVTVIHEHGHTISQHVDIRKKMMMQFESESYYYSKYRKVTKLSIFIGKLSLKFYMFLKIR